MMIINKLNFLNRRGFTFIEVLASLISLGIVVLAAQSLIMISNRFMVRSDVDFSSMQDVSFMNDYMCLKFTLPVFVQVDRTRSFHYDHINKKYTKISLGDEEINPATLSYPLLSKNNKNFETPELDSNHPLGPVSHTAVREFLNGDFKDSTKNKRLRAHLDDKIATGADTSDVGNVARDYKSKYYDVYADTHTLITFMVDPSDADMSSTEMAKLGRISKSDGHGIIFASRCIKKEEGPGDIGAYLKEHEVHSLGSVIDETDNVSDLKTEETALYILEGLKYRPFYFQDHAENKDKIKCCDVSAAVSTIEKTTTGHCSNMEDWIPVTYVIRFASEGGELGSDANDAIVNLDKNDDGNTSLRAYLFNEHETVYTEEWIECESKITDQAKDSCKEDIHADMATRYYFPKLREKIDFPITFSSVHELPINKSKLSNTWAFTFVAPSLQHQDSSMQLKLIDLENGCLKANHSLSMLSLSRQECRVGDFSVQSNPTKKANKANLMTLIKSKSCPFRYVSLASGGGPIYLGAHFEKK